MTETDTITQYNECNELARKLGYEIELADGEMRIKKQQFVISTEYCFLGVRRCLLAIQNAFLYQ